MEIVGYLDLEELERIRLVLLIHFKVDQNFE
jgi:hypothetical protein